jgi:biphenyl-2,3-diol 1,2-dioxygenase
MTGPGASASSKGTPTTCHFELLIEFYHCNARHHTLAMAPVPSPKKMQHFMLEVASLDDVGFALDRLNENSVEMSMTLGKHTNDHMVSFYVKTPSGFELEYGWGGRHVDDQDWRVVRHQSMSVWGHRRTA